MRGPRGSSAVRTCYYCNLSCIVGRGKMPLADQVPVIETPKGSNGTAAEAVASFWENLLPTSGGRPRVDERGVYVGEAKAGR